MNHLVDFSHGNDLLFGKDPEENIVGCYQLNDSQIRLFFRTPDGVVQRDDPFFPFFFLSDGELLDGFTPFNKEKYWLIQLEGANYYRHLGIFRSWKNYRAALDHVNSSLPDGASENDYQNTSGQNSHLTYSRGDAITQYLLQTGKTLFKGMLFDDLHRLQLDIETYYQPDKKRKGKGIGEDPIIIVSLSDNRSWEHVIHSKGRAEKDLLEELVHIIRQKDPDVIEGHNIFGFDLPYLQRRCELNGVRFAIGRNGLVPRSYPATIRFAERSADFQFCDIPGRHVIDTYFLAQNYDTSKRTLPSYGLKAVAKFFGFASPNRTYVDYKDIASTWDDNPETLLAYALDDVRETRELAALLSGSNFSMTSMVPYSYANTARLGPAAKIEALIIREYLKRKVSIPRPSIGQQQTGGFTEVFVKGILGPIVYADVESLYPSIMLTFDVCPKSDSLKAFPTILKDLKELRFAAKKRAEEEKERGNTSLSYNFDAMQSSFKIIINAMYGYLGFGSGMFNDFEEADRVTTKGQEIAKKMIREFESRGAKVIEVDTDGIFLVPPPDVVTEEEERQLVSEVSSTMPQGIRIGFDGRFKKMISYMKKNYVLLDYNEKLKLKGSAFVSRSGEKFGRDFVREGFILLLNDDIQGLHDLYVKYRNDLMDHRLHISDFSRTESMKTTLDQYATDVRAGKRSKSITYEIALRQGLEIAKGDRITYYVAGTGNPASFVDNGRLAEEWNKEQPDENTGFYLKRLDEYAQKFLPFFKPQDFSSIFSADTLFAFSPEGIEVVKEIRHHETGDLYREDSPF
ncbi:DNA polymerase B region [Chlorobaculum parvum NCIB 8327]|uniref:DNA-directed DNA polymerase n=1 Tax=Chlorobaculum parvum (strain DSM 263 / NCIMB 8327) TaxID=517417 RepID=B3QQX0_CHLP8|nr:DNA polymerase domain-containing protein [Chlorobaculum parvum]ACF10435.1 DNA polymerase B region [Chlorobaculum parvum NCIB 8327]